MPRPKGRVAVAVLFALLALNALVQVALVPFGFASDPLALVLLQTLVGLTGAAAAWGSWTGERWAPAAATAYGVVTAGMLVALEPILDLGAEARSGLLLGAGVVLGASLLAAWYLRHSIAAAPGVRAGAPPQPAP